MRGELGEKVNCIPCNEEKYISFSRDVVVDKFSNDEGKEVLVKRELRMGEEYDSSKPASFITYLEANNLYGWAMSKPLPTHGFEWMSDDEIYNWREITERDGVGCILEVDLAYPKDLHDLHNDYPLAPESVKLEGSDVSKLIPNLNDKVKYVYITSI